MKPSIQLPLSLHLHDDAIFDNFFVGGNQAVLHHLQHFVSGITDETFIYCYGDSGVGRTHLLQACCHALNEQGAPAFYLPLSYSADLSIDILLGLEDLALVCIDDIDVVMGNRVWEEALFHFYNRAQEAKTKLLISSFCPPRQLNCLLPDLQTRLMSGLTLSIEGLSDTDKVHALQMRAANRGLTLTDDVAHYVIRHYSRNMRDLFAVLETLDHASLAAKRRITVPFVKTVLKV